MIDIEIIGTAQLEKKLAQIAEEVKRSILKNALLTVGREMQGYLVEAAPISKRGSHGNKLASRNHEAGNLQRSIKVLPDKKNGNFPTVWAKPIKGGNPDGWYAKFVEYGHMTRKGAPRKGKIRKNDLQSFVKGQGFGFIRRTFDRHEESMKQAIDTMVQEGIQKEFAR